jgi:hypothetical protein
MNPSYIRKPRRTPKSSKLELKIALQMNECTRVDGLVIYLAPVWTPWEPPSKKGYVFTSLQKRLCVQTPLVLFTIHTPSHSTLHPSIHPNILPSFHSSKYPFIQTSFHPSNEKEEEEGGG